MNTINHGGEHDVLAAATEDHESVIALTRELVAIPSRGGIDPYEPVLNRLSGWLEQRHLAVTVLKDKTGSTVGLTCEIRGAPSRPPLSARRLSGHRTLRRRGRLDPPADLSGHR